MGAPSSLETLPSPVGVATLHAGLIATTKRKKGRKRDAAQGPDLTRIMGFVPPNDVPAESESDGDDGAPPEGEADREWIKMRSTKLAGRHAARLQAAAGGTGSKAC